MITIKPFRGLRPRAELAAQATAPPYDVLSSEEAREMARDNPISFLHVNKPEIDLPVGTNPYSDMVYTTGRDNLQKFIREGILIQDDLEAIYIYRLLWRERQQTGYFCLSSVEDYDAGRIKKHEFTRPDKEADRTKLIDTMSAQVGPVYLTYKSRPDLDGFLEEAAQGAPAVEFVTPDEVTHQLWVVTRTELIGKIVSGFRQLEVLYIADGHHRAASASNVQKLRMKKNPHHTGAESYNYIASVIFPHNQLRILPYNRVVKDLNDLDKEAFLARISQRFDCAKLAKDAEVNTVHSFGMYLDGDWYVLLPHADSYDSSDLLSSLDVNILMRNLLEPILGIGNPRTDRRIDFVGGIRGNGELVRLVSSGRFKVAFALYPTSVEALLKVADAGEVMPPKSTWFEPKLRSGMVVHIL